MQESSGREMNRKNDSKLKDKESEKEKGMKKPQLDGNPKIDSFHNKDGLVLKTYAWTVDNPKGVVILVHGLNTSIRLEYLRHNVEISDNYKKATLKDGDDFYVYKNSWIESLNQNNYSVYGMDLQGHGCSEGYKNSRCHVNKFDDLAYDVIQYINRIHDLLCLSDRKTQDLSIHDNITNTKLPPFFLMGLSMGGNIVLRILEILGKSKDSGKKVQIKGCCVLAGMISIEHLQNKSSYKYFYIPLSKFMSTVFPSLRMTPSIRFEKFPFVNDIFSYDKNRSKKPITSRLGHELLTAIENLHNDVEHIPQDVHLFFAHSKLDSLCYYNGMINFTNTIKNPSKEIMTIEDMDHVLTVEPGNEQVLQNVLQWMNKILK